MTADAPQPSHPQGRGDAQPIPLAEPVSGFVEQVVLDAADFLSDAGSGTGDSDIFSGPRRVGQYTIDRPLGRGGVGVVYLAHQSGLHRHVALKVMPAGTGADHEDLARFREEARMAAAVPHPNIVQVYEVGEQHGLAYLAMEYVGGGNLQKRLAGQPLDPLDAARLLEPVARAVHFVHLKGIVHRDLKPSNILLDTTEVPGVAPACSLGTPKIADFGLGKCSQRAAALTATGIALGTPAYMAPEQARGDGHLIGAATDVYSLGAIFYECLTGRPPFLSNPQVSAMEQVCHTRPTSPRQLRPALPRNLERVCLKCLEKEPRNRFRSAEAFADALRRFIDRHTPAPRGPRGPTSVTRREKVLAAVALAAFAAMLVAVGWRLFG